MGTIAGAVNAARTNPRASTPTTAPVVQFGGEEHRDDLTHTASLLSGYTGSRQSGRMA